MLEVTVVKDRHWGADNARPLLRYIQDCHVYSPEAALASEDDLSAAESWWVGVLESGISLTRLKSELGRQLESRQFQSVFNDPMIDEHWLRRSEYLYRNKRLLWHAERCTADEQREGMQLQLRGIDNMREGHGLLRAGRLDECISVTWEGLGLDAAAEDYRDRICARGIDLAEGRIRARYPSLAGVEPLKYVVEIGGSHAPERYVRTKVIVADETGGIKQHVEAVHRAFRTGKSLEEMRHDILFMLALEAKDNKGIFTPLEDLSAMTVQELEKVLRGAKFPSIGRLQQPL